MDDQITGIIKELVVCPHLTGKVAENCTFCEYCIVKCFHAPLEARPTLNRARNSSRDFKSIIY